MRRAVIAVWLLASAPGAGATEAEHGWQAGRDGGHCFVLEVVDGRGRPVREAVITLRVPGEEPPPGSRPGGLRWHTGRSGQVCRRELLEGASLDVEAPPLLGGRCAGATRVELEPWYPKADQPPLRRVTLELRPARRTTVRGRVASAGRPVADATVTLKSVSWTGPRGQACAVAPETWVRSGSDGAFTFTGVPRGRATLEVVHPRHADAAVEVVAPGPPVEVVLDGGASWRGRVLDPEGDPLPSCQVSLRTSAGRRLQASCTGAAFSLGALPPGPAQLQVDSHGGALGSRTLRLPVQIARNEQRHEDIRWPAGEAIAGQLLTPTGLGVAGASLVAARAGDRQGIWLRTDEDGHFTFRHLPPGRWVLTWRGDPRNPARIEVTPPQRALRFVLPAMEER